MPATGTAPTTTSGPADMDTVASLALAFLAIVVLVNVANGTLKAWLAAKFLHRTPATSSASASAP